MPGMLTTIATSMLARFDGWENVVLGLGGEKDPSAYTTFSGRPQLSDPTLEALYVEDHFAAKVIEKVVRSAMRPGWELVAGGGDPVRSRAIAEAYRMREDELGVRAEMSQGACWGRTFGGALTWIGADDHRPVDSPLDETAIESVRFLHTFDRRDVQVWRYYSDPTHPKFRRPELYLVQPQIVAAAAGGLTGLDLAIGGAAMQSQTAGGVVLHESRCVIWGGQPTTDARKIQLAGWEDSVLERCWEPLKQIGEDYGAKSLILGRLSQAVYRIKGLYKMIAGGEEEVLRRRIAMLDRSRSRARAIALDLDEEFVNVTTPIAGVSDVIDRSAVRLAAAADMPVSILMSQTPDGSDASEGDQETWSETVDGWRVDELRPRHERIAKLIMLAKDFEPTRGTEPEKWEIRYRPLRVPKPDVLANQRKTEADTLAVYVDKGFAQAEQLALHLFSPSSGRTDIVLDEKDLQAALERRRALANQPPKDNAELGTVGARATAAADLVKEVAKKQLPRESALAMLREFFRLDEKIANEMLGPESFVPAPDPDPTPPGPPSGPRMGSGAGAPQGMPGFNAGGDPREEQVPRAEKPNEGTGGA